MQALIIETSSEKSLIALAEDGVPIATKSLPGGPELSKTLALEVKNLLHASKPDYIAVGTGPGSYTGTRVGASLAMSLAFGWQIPLFGFCSLASFAPDAPQWSVLVDARMGGFYCLKNSSETEAIELLLPSSNKEPENRLPLSFETASTARRLSLEAAETELRDAPLLASPHPDLIKKRLPLLGKWIETSPDPFLLANLAHRLFLKGNPAPISLSYLGAP